MRVSAVEGGGGGGWKGAQVLPNGAKKNTGDLERTRTRPGGGDEDQAGQASGGAERHVSSRFRLFPCNVGGALLIGHANQQESRELKRAKKTKKNTI